MITAAAALSAEEEFPEMLYAVERHPSIEICGIARSSPDLIRLLSRFRPSILIATPCILEEFIHEGMPKDGSHHLSAPVTFILFDGKEEAFGIELARIMQLPLRIGGAMEWETQDIEGVVRYIKAKVDIYNCAAHTPRLPKNKGHPKGGLIMFSGSKGGVGNTLISCSLASMISSDKRVLLMEMGGCRSQLSHIKSSPEGKTLAELSPLAEEISWDLLRVSLFKHPSGFYLLPLARGNGKGHPLEPSKIAPLLRNLLFLFDVVILDLQDPWSGGFPITIPFLPMVMLVTLPDVLSTACARDAAEFMRRSGMDTSRMRLLVNRKGGRHMLVHEELERATGLQIAAALPDDARSGLDFCELGELPRPESALGKAVASLASVLGLAPPTPTVAGALSRTGKIGKRYEKRFPPREGSEIR